MLVPQIRKLVEQEAFQLSLFDEQDLAEIEHVSYPGERLVVCKNPLLAEERARKRTAMLADTEARLQDVVEATQRAKRPLRGKAEIGVRVGKVLARSKMGKHFTLTIEDDSLSFQRNEEQIREEAALDGIYILRTSVPEKELSAEAVVEAYKELAKVERAFRTLKPADIQVRPIHHRRLVLTATGESLLPRARAAMRLTQAALNEVRRLDDVPRGRLRISTGPWETPEFGALLAQFGLLYPEVSVELSAKTRHVDLVSEQFDVALRGGVVRDPELTKRLLFRTDTLVVASPDYLAIRGIPSRPEELVRHACLCGFGGGRRPVTEWPLRAGGSIAVRGPLVSNDMQILLGAVVHGLGTALLPQGLAQRAVDVGVLVPVLEGQVGEDSSISLVWQEREFMEPKVRAFVDLAVEWASQRRQAPLSCPPEQDQALANTTNASASGSERRSADR